MTESIVAQLIADYQPNYKNRKYKTEDLLGKRFGRLVVVKELQGETVTRKKAKRRILCKCDCGNEVVVFLPYLINGETKSCGCLNKERVSKINKTHGLSGHPLYGMWKRMRGRCFNVNGKDYPDYGGRGITVCKEWEDFQTFYDWAIDKWTHGSIIDREDVDKGYSPDNCRFVDEGLSSRNTRLLRKDNKSGFRGVWVCSNGKWTANIRCNNDRICLGRFDNAIDAAKAYDDKARELNSGHPLNFSGELE